MTEPFNRYRQWLTLESDSACPNFYELLNLPLFEQDVDKIRAHADRALAEVRSHRPGAQAADWAHLLDELAEAKACLTHSEQKGRYDASLQQPRHVSEHGSGDHKPSRGEETHIAAVNQLPGLFPPGMEAKGTEASQRNQDTGKTGQRLSKSKSTNTAGPEFIEDVTSAGKPPSPSNTSAATPRATRLLSDDFDDPLAGTAASLSQASLAEPVNAHVAAPPIEENSLLPIAAAVAGVLVVIAAGVMLLAWRASFPASPENQPAATNPTETPVSSAQQPPPQQLSARQNSTTDWQHSATPHAQTTTRDMSHASGSAQSLVIGSEQAAANNELPSPAVAASDSVTAPPAPQLPVAAPAELPSEPAAAVVEQPSSELAAGSRDPAQLSRALVSARQALESKDFELARLEIHNAQALARSPEHQALVGRLEALIEQSQLFWENMAAIVPELRAAEELKFGEGGLIVLVVESGTDFIVVRKEGRNHRYTFAEMPVGLALAIAKTRLGTGQPDHLIQLGACLAADNRENPLYQSEARRYWQQAQAAGGDTEDLLQTLTDSYNL